MSQMFYAIFAAVFGLALSMPSDIRAAHKLDLEAVLNKTVCPIKVDMDVDLDRIPKRIKVMKCADDPNQWCKKMSIPKHECCQHDHDHVRLECVEVTDVVMVHFPKDGITQPYRVPVGCTCMLQQIAMLRDAGPDGY